MWHFNSHAHVERDHGRTYQTPLMSISTHTLTWSVTTSAEMFSYFVNISTHTLTWSVTGYGATQIDISWISTHTLTWSVTNKNGKS